MNAVLTWLNDFLYIYILVALLAVAGIYSSIVTKGVQFRLLKKGLQTLTEKKPPPPASVLEILLASLPPLPWAILALYSGCG